LQLQICANERIRLRPLGQRKTKRLNDEQLICSSQALDHAGKVFPGLMPGNLATAPQGGVEVVCGDYFSMSTTVSI
jgi:hypothetical protein